MDFKECLYSRRSIRNFTKEKVSDTVIKDIISAAIQAPSACNFAAWKFIVIKDDNKNKEKLENQLIMNAPYGILVTYRNDLYVTGRVYNDYYQSAAAAIENMLLYINSIGLGGCWVCGLPSEKQIKKAFGIPKNFDVIAYVVFGHPQKKEENSKKAIEYHYGNEKDYKNHKRRFTLEQVICDNKFEIKEGDCTQTKYPKKSLLMKNKLKKKIVKFLRFIKLR